MSTDAVIVYRAYDEAGELLYIGMTSDVQLRMVDHHAQHYTRHWAERVTRIETETHPDRRTASWAKRRLIAELHPTFNRRGVGVRQLTPENCTHCKDISLVTDGDSEVNLRCSYCEGRVKVRRIA
jgi:predicted GIY-YIG superfamily endonuclease